MGQTNQNLREGTLAHLLSTLTRDAACLREEQTEVSFEERKRVINRLLALRQEIHALQKLSGGRYLSYLSTLEQSCSDALIEAYELDYRKHSGKLRLRSCVFADTQKKILNPLCC